MSQACGRIYCYLSCYLSCSLGRSPWANADNQVSGEVGMVVVVVPLGSVCLLGWQELGGVRATAFLAEVQGWAPIPAGS